MSFFQPHQLLWGLLAIAIVLAYYLRGRRRSSDVSGMMLWRRTFARRGKWRKWQRPASVAMLLSILAVIVLAAARPCWTSVWTSARTLIVVVDNSASMNATDVAPTRLAVAHRELMSLIEGLKRYEQMMIVSAGGKIQILSRMTGDVRQLRTAANRIAPTDGPDRMANAVALARRIAAEHGNPEIYLLSDGCFAAAPELAQDGDLRFVHCAGGDGDDGDDGVSPSNVAITQLAARANATQPGRYEVLLEVTNYSADSREFGVELRSPRGQAWEYQVAIGPGETWRQLQPFESEQGGLLQATLDGEDHLAADNAAWLSLAPHPPIVIQLDGAATSADPSSAGQRLLTALKSVPLVRVVTAGDVARRTNGRRITVFADTVPAQLPSGPVLAIAPKGDCELWRAAGTIEGPISVNDQRAEAETSLIRTVLDGVQWNNLVIDALAAVECQAAPDAVLRSVAGDPVLSAWQRPEGRVLLLHLPLDQTDLTLRAAFPALVANAIDWLGERQNVSANAAIAGELLRVPAAESPGPRQLRSPSGRAIPLAAGQTAAGPLDEIGVWAIETIAVERADTAHDKMDVRADAARPAPGAVQRIAVCNLLNPRESNLAANRGLAPSAVVSPPTGDWPTPWSLLLFLAGILLTVDWFLVQRKSLI